MQSINTRRLADYLRDDDARSPKTTLRIMIDKKGEIIRRSTMNQGNEEPVVHSVQSIVIEDSDDDGVNPLTMFQDFFNMHQEPDAAQILNMRRS